MVGVGWFTLTLGGNGQAGRQAHCSSSFMEMVFHQVSGRDSKLGCTIIHWMHVLIRLWMNFNQVKIWFRVQGNGFCFLLHIYLTTCLVKYQFIGKVTQLTNHDGLAREKIVSLPLSIHPSSLQGVLVLGAGSLSQRVLGWFLHWMMLDTSSASHNSGMQFHPLSSLCIQNTRQQP